MEPVTPKGTAPPLPQVVRFSKLSFQFLHHPTDSGWVPCFHEQMGMITRDAIRHQRHWMLFQSQPQAFSVFRTGDSKTEQEMTIVASVS
jgi:hypothetical protein